MQGFLKTKNSLPLKIYQRPQTAQIWGFCKCTRSRLCFHLCFWTRFWISVVVLFRLENSPCSIFMIANIRGFRFKQKYWRSTDLVRICHRMVDSHTLIQPSSPLTHTQVSVKETLVCVCVHWNKNYWAKCTKLCSQDMMFWNLSPIFNSDTPMSP